MNLTISEKEDQLIITHKSKKKTSNFWSSTFGAILSFVAFICLFSNIGLFLFCIPVLIATLKIASEKIKNNITIRLEENNIIVIHRSNYLASEKTKKYTFSAQNIRQVYVRRSRKKNVIWWFGADNVFCSEIFIQRHDGQTQRILGDNEGFFVDSPKEAQFIKNKIEHFLELTNDNSSKKIQYITPNLTQKLPAPKQRKINKETEISKMTIKDFEVGVLFDYKNETWEVIAQTQYDWQRGNTDTLYQVQNSQNATILLLVCQDMAVYSTWLEERLPYHELAKNNLNKAHQGLPLEFEFRDKLFLKESLSSGHEFVGTNQGQSIKEWKYISEDSTETLRILEHEDEDIFAFLGKKIEEFEFSNILLF